MTTYGMKKKFANHIFGKGFISKNIWDSYNSVWKEIKQPKLLNEQKKSKCFEKSEE